MKFEPLNKDTAEKALLEQEYAKAHVIGKLRIGDSVLFLRVRMKTYYIPFSSIRRCFRRVRIVHAGGCCGGSSLAIENMVICDESGELAELQMPGEKAGKSALEEMQKKMPHVIFTAPMKKNEMEEEPSK